MTSGIRQPCCQRGYATPPPQPAPAGYALPTTGINHGCTSGYDRNACCFGQLAWRQCAAPAVRSHTGWVALRARHVRVAGFGVRQPCCRASRAHEPARGTPFPILVTEILDVLVSIIESVSNECDTCAQACCCTRFMLAHQRPRPAPDGGGKDACTQAESLRHEERLHPGLTQHDMWLIHSPAGVGYKRFSKGQQYGVRLVSELEARAPRGCRHIHTTIEH